MEMVASPPAPSSSATFVVHLLSGSHPSTIVHLSSIVVHRPPAFPSPSPFATSGLLPLPPSLLLPPPPFIAILIRCRPSLRIRHRHRRGQLSLFILHLAHSPLFPPSLFCLTTQRLRRPCHRRPPRHRLSPSPTASLPPPVPPPPSILARILSRATGRTGSVHYYRTTLLWPGPSRRRSIARVIHACHPDCVIKCQ